MDGMLRRAQAGYSTGGSVYGYRSMPTHTGRQDAQGRPLADHVDRQIDPAQACAIVGMFRMYAGRHGLTAIAKTLNGLPRRRKDPEEYFAGICPPAPRHGSGSWAGTAVREILRRPLYIGQIVWGATKRDG
jgi:site-specific DNA recombinase